MALSDAEIISAVRADVNDTATPYKTSDEQMAYFIKTAVRTIVGMAPHTSIGSPGSAYPTTASGMSDGLEGAIVEYMMYCICSRAGKMNEATGHLAAFKTLVELFVKSP